MPVEPPLRILVLDADMVPSLTIARSLSRRGCIIDTGSHTKRPLTGYSRCIEDVFSYPNPLAETEEFVTWVVQHTKANHYDLVIPVTERTLIPLSMYRERFEHVVVAMPSAKSLELVLDKSQTLALASSLDVPIPGGIYIETLEQLSEVEKDLQYPVVLKPARSIGSGKGGSSHLQVSYAFDARGLVTGCTHALRFGPVVLQEFFRGDGVGIELIAKKGEILYAFQHRRLHEVPLTGGGSSLRKSEAVDPALLASSRRLIEALEWNGVAMVEFKHNAESGDFCLMEINGRFWGSLPLAGAAGADFPSMLLDLELEQQVTACAPYKENIYCRLLARDLHWYEAVLRGGDDPRIAIIPPRSEIVKELGLFFLPRHRFDVQSITDPLPGLVDLKRIGVGYCRRALTLAQEKLFFIRQHRAWSRGHVTTGMKTANSILFLCYGNINRSALADAMIQAYAEDSGVEVLSAGFHLEEGRPADPVMIEVAAARGVDMAALRSTTVDETLLRKADLIFVMEKVHYDRLEKLGASIAGKTYLLGAHSRNGGALPPEIDDPYAGPKQGYEVCYERISEAVDHLKAMIASRSGD